MSVRIRKTSQPIVARAAVALLVILVCFVAGAGVVHFRNARDIELAKRTPAGPAYGYVMQRVHFDRPTLRQALTTLNELSQANMRVDWDGLEAVGFDVDMPIPLTIDTGNVTLDRILPVVMRAAGGEDSIEPRFDVVDGKIFVSNSEAVRKAASVVRVYDVRDLLISIRGHRRNFPDEPRLTVENLQMESPSDDATYLVNLIEYCIEVETWRDNGGTSGDIRMINGRLVVIQTPAGHREIEKLLADLRTMPAGEKLPEPVAPASLW